VDRNPTRRNGPGEYHAKDDLEFVNQHFQREGSQAQLLVEGGVDDDEFLTRVNETRTDAADDDGIAYTLRPAKPTSRTRSRRWNGPPDRTNRSTSRSPRPTPTTTGVPDENVSALYDQLYEIDEEAASQGTPPDRRRGVPIGSDDRRRRGDATASETTAEMRTMADEFEDGSNGRWSAIATGDPIVSYIVEQDLLDTVLESLVITPRRGVPVPHRGLLADRCQRLAGCHHPASGRVLRQLDPGNDVPHRNALQRVDGDDHETSPSGSGSPTASTSANATGSNSSGRGTSGRHYKRPSPAPAGAARQCRDHRRRLPGRSPSRSSPALRQFGIITGLTITYAFLASVVVLPTLLVVWTRYFGPDVSFDTSGVQSETAAASDGGTVSEQGDSE